MTSGLMKRFAGGDPTAVRELYGSYGKAVFTVAFSSLHDHGLAEEAVQQTFLQAWRAAKSFEGGRDPGPWLYAIARRVAVDLYRRERRHQGRQPLSADTDVAALPRSFEQTWEAWQIRLALDKIPADQREIIAATHFLGLTHEGHDEGAHLSRRRIVAVTFERLPIACDVIPGRGQGAAEDR